MTEKVKTMPPAMRNISVQLLNNYIFLKTELKFNKNVTAIFAYVDWNGTVTPQP